MIPDGDVLRPKVIIVPKQTPCPAVTGDGVWGQLCISGSKLFIVNDASGTWECVGDQTA